MRRSLRRTTVLPIVMSHAPLPNTHVAMSGSWRGTDPDVNGALLVACMTSDAGKSVIVAGIVRWLHREGVRVAPFKAQNMSLNSFVTADGAEIGRAQAMQAAAAGLEPDARMNPVLLKPGHTAARSWCSASPSARSTPRSTPTMPTGSWGWRRTASPSSAVTTTS